MQPQVLVNEQSLTVSINIIVYQEYITKFDSAFKEVFSNHLSHYYKKNTSEAYISTIEEIQPL